MAARKTKTTHLIDGCVYKTKKDVERHKLLKANPDVKTFHLPDAKEKSTYSRYGAHKCEINGIIFDSVLEGMYYAYLLELKRDKFIKRFTRQVTFVLMEGFTHKLSGKKVRPSFVCTTMPAAFGNRESAAFLVRASSYSSAGFPRTAATTGIPVFFAV